MCGCLRFDNIIKTTMQSAYFFLFAYFLPLFATCVYIAVSGISKCAILPVHTESLRSWRWWWWWLHKYRRCIVVIVSRREWWHCKCNRAVWPTWDVWRERVPDIRPTIHSIFLFVIIPPFACAVDNIIRVFCVECRAAKHTVLVLCRCSCALAYTTQTGYVANRMAKSCNACSAYIDCAIEIEYQPNKSRITLWKILCLFLFSHNHVAFFSCVVHFLFALLFILMNLCAPIDCKHILTAI